MTRHAKESLVVVETRNNKAYVHGCSAADDRHLDIEKCRVGRPWVTGLLRSAITRGRPILILGSSFEPRYSEFEMTICHRMASSQM